MNWTLGMPNLGHKMDEGRVQAWLKAVGDPVRAGEAVVIVESDKASFEVESPADGVLLPSTPKPAAWCRWALQSGLSATQRLPLPLPLYLSQPRQPRCAHARRPLRGRWRTHWASTLNSLPAPAKAA